MLLLLLLLTLASAQRTDFNDESCVYSFVVPPPPPGEVCDPGTTGKIDQLKDKFHEITRKLEYLKKQGFGRGDATLTFEQPSLKWPCEDHGFLYSIQQDCQDVKESGEFVSGVYTIRVVDLVGQPVAKSGPIDTDRGHVGYVQVKSKTEERVYCHLASDIGWTVLMRRENFDVVFNKTWKQFQEGFGDMESGDFWLGLDKMHRITSSKLRRYSVTVTAKVKDIPYVMSYDSFKVGDESSGYRLHALGYHGDRNMRNCLHHMTPFSSRDHVPLKEFYADIEYSKNEYPYYNHREYYFGNSRTVNISTCAMSSGGGWWSPDPADTVPTGTYVYGRSGCGTCGLTAKVPYFEDSNTSRKHNLTFVEVKIRPVW